MTAVVEDEGDLEVGLRGGVEEVVEGAEEVEGLTEVEVEEEPVVGTTEVEAEGAVAEAFVEVMLLLRSFGETLSVFSSLSEADARC